MFWGLPVLTAPVGDLKKVIAEAVAEYRDHCADAEPGPNRDDGRKAEPLSAEIEAHIEATVKAALALAGTLAKDAWVKVTLHGEPGTRVSVHLKVVDAPEPEAA